jgi:hypothetical protein
MGYKPLAEAAVGNSYEMVVPEETQSEINPANETVPNSDQKPIAAGRIARKLDGGRPHKVYDYMFIQMSNEQFAKEYAGSKIQVISSDFLSKDAQVG